MADDYLHFKSSKEETNTDKNRYKKRIFFLTLKDLWKSPYENNEGHHKPIKTK